LILISILKKLISHPNSINMKNSNIFLILAVSFLAFAVVIGIFVGNPYSNDQIAKTLNFSLIKGFIIIAMFMVSLTLLIISVIESKKEEEKE